MIEKPRACEVCGGDMVSVEYSRLSKHHYDGVSEYACPTGHWRIGRWCGQELFGEEFERPECEGKGHSRTIVL